MGALEVLEPEQRGAVDVAPGVVVRRREAIGVVGHVAVQHGHHLEHALGRAVARVGLGRSAAAGRQREQRQRAPRPLHRLAGRVTIAFSIFSVAITAAASWSVSTPRVDQLSRPFAPRQVITVSTSALVRPPGGMRTRKSVSDGQLDPEARERLRERLHERVVAAVARGHRAGALPAHRHGHLRARLGPAADRHRVALRRARADRPAPSARRPG